MAEETILRETILRDGKPVLVALLTVTSLTLEKLMKVDPVAFFEASEVARKPEHKPWGPSVEVLKAYSLYPMHGETRRIVLASIEGEGADLCLVNPAAGVTR
jgi:hypothetical protein